MIEKRLWKVVILSAWLNIVASGLAQSNKSFSECNPRKLLSHKNRAGFMKILICTGMKDGVPQWQFTDGSSTLGEVFNPAKDCSDIVDHVPDAEDGFYWIALDKKTKHEVWCDVRTDGGGFMLVGMKDSPVSWTVPSNSTPVNPQGPPHWSSVLGNMRVMDFGIQFSSKQTFQGSEAHWFYRLKQKRQLGELFTNDKSSGCTESDPGIGDVMFVKDVRTRSVATTNFNCSIFGPHTHPSLGWARMNYCLRHECKNGYGVFPGPFPFQYAQYGSFSYSALFASSGIDRRSTAFVGCDNGKCCACFGPKGGRQNYCGPKCTAINGGTVAKKVFVWFWVRTRMPERLWKRCMEFTMKNSSGRIEKYFIDRQTGIAHKGSCSKQFKTFLNEGTLTISDEESFKKIPDVPGLLSYRIDNKQLYVNEGSKWQALSSEQEVQQLQQKVKGQEKTIQKQENIVTNMKNDIQILQKKIQTQESKIQAQGSKIQAQQNKAKNQERAIKNQGSSIQVQHNKINKVKKTIQDLQKKIQKQEIKIKTQENKIHTHGSKIQRQETKIKTVENNGQRRDKEIQMQRNVIKKHEKEYQGVSNFIKNYHTIEPSCSTLRTKLPSAPSAMYFIKPKGLDISVPVNCNMTSKNGVGVTEIGHDSESRIYVHGYELPGSYKRKIKYHLPMRQIVAIIKQSQHCEQFIKYKCFHSGLWLSRSRPYGWWVSSQGSKMSYWGGADVDSGECACAKSNNCTGGEKCNCDMNDEVWREDSGYLKDKNTLPVTELRFGDTSDVFSTGKKESGYHTLGKLRCWG